MTYLRARQYDSSTGRFTSLDPVLGSLGMPQTLNRYPYVVNNPTRFTDPTGEFVFLFFVAAILIGAALNTGLYAATCGDSCSTAGYVGAALGGAAAGAIGYLTAGAGLGVAMLGGAAANMAAYGIESALTGTFTWEGLALAGGLGAGFGVLGAGARAFGTVRQFGKTFDGFAGADDVLGRFWGGLRRTLRGDLDGIGGMRGALAEMRVANGLGKNAIAGFRPNVAGRNPDILLRGGGYDPGRDAPRIRTRSDRSRSRDGGWTAILRLVPAALRGVPADLRSGPPFGPPGKAESASRNQHESSDGNRRRETRSGDRRRRDPSYGGACRKIHVP